MGIKLTVEFDNMADALDFIQDRIDDKPAKAAPSKKAAAKPNTPAAATLAPAPVPTTAGATTSPVRAPVAAGPSEVPDVTDAGFKAWMSANVTAQSTPVLQSLLTQFGVSRGSELNAEQRVNFIQRFEAQA
jgi:hypothetical protein